MYKEICSKGAKNRHNYLLLCNGDVDFKVSITFIYPTPPKKNEVQKKKTVLFPTLPKAAKFL